MYTSNIKHIVINALRASGYGDDAKHILDARVLGVKEDGPGFSAMVYYDTRHEYIPHAVIYVEWSVAGHWVAEY